MSRRERLLPLEQVENQDTRQAEEHHSGEEFYSLAPASQDEEEPFRTHPFIGEEKDHKQRNYEAEIVNEQID